MGRVGEIDSVDDETIKASVSRSVENTREVNDYVPYGLDSRPVKGLKCLLISLREKAFKILIGVRRKETDKIAKSGESRLYSAFGSEVHLKEDGTIDIKTASGGIITMAAGGKINLNGNAKSAMNFQDFEAIWNAFIIAYELHVHTSALPGVPTSPPTLPLTNPQKDMSGAENDKVLMND